MKILLLTSMLLVPLCAKYTEGEEGEQSAVATRQEDVAAQKEERSESEEKRKRLLRTRDPRKKEAGLEIQQHNGSGVTELQGAQIVIKPSGGVVSEEKGSLVPDEEAQKISIHTIMGDLAFSVPAEALKKEQAPHMREMPKLSLFNRIVDRYFSSNYQHRLQVIKILVHDSRFVKGLARDVNVVQLQRDLTSVDFRIQRRAQKTINELYRRYEKGFKDTIKSINGRYYDALTKVESVVYKQPGATKLVFVDDGDRLLVYPADGTEEFSKNPTIFNKDEIGSVRDMFGKAQGNKLVLPIEDLEGFFSGTKPMQMVLASAEIIPLRTSDLSQGQSTDKDRLIEYLSTVNIGKAYANVSKETRWMNLDFSKDIEKDVKKEIQAMVSSGARDSFVVRVQQLQAKLSVIQQRVTDPLYVPDVKFNETDGSVMIDGIYYTPAEVLVADVDKGISQFVFAMKERATKLLQDDPITFFNIEDNDSARVITILATKLGLPKQILKGVLEDYLFDKKKSLKIHPDRNTARKDEANTAFKIYSGFRDLFNARTKDTTWSSIF